MASGSQPVAAAWRRSFNLYLALVAGAGLALLAWSLAQASQFQTGADFFLFLALALVGQTLTTSLAVSSRAGITYQVAPAVAVATLPFFGPAAAVLVEAVAAIGLWLIKPADERTWKKSWRQLLFNLGMSVVAMAAAGAAFVAVGSWLGTETPVGILAPWLVAAVVNDQVNMWLLIGILTLQHGHGISPLAIWRQNLWAMPISILLMSVGGGLLAYSLRQFGTVGLAIFFLPILLSAYAFRLYVRQMQGQMDQLEQMVTERTAALAASNRRKAALLAVLTHDMITPLTSTQLYAELIKKEPVLVLENPDLLDIMLHSQKTLLNMVRNILDIERLQEDGSLPLQKEEFDLAEAITFTAGMVRAQAKERGIALECQIRGQSLPIAADRQQIERVLLNLFTNAVKYTPAGGAVQARAWRSNGELVIEVQDTGYGIPAHELSHIFDRFTRAEQQEKGATGTGLGLAISKALVENHRGEISVESEAGKGSTFTVRLPAS